MKIFFYCAAVLYPVLVFLSLVIFKVPLRIFSLFLMVFGFFLFLNITGGKKNSSNTGGLWFPSGGKKRFSLIQPLLLFAVGVLCFFTNAPLVLKLYPVIISGIFLAAFGHTLFSPPSMIFRFALLADKMNRFPKIRGTLGETRIAAYCRKVTIVWCIFFVGNGCVSAFTVFCLSENAWVLYNGGISYILMGILFGIELTIRKMKAKTIPKAIPLSVFTATSRKPDTVLCYSGAYSAGLYKTWNDFLTGTTALRKLIGTTNKKRWLLHCNDYWYFLLAYTALLQCKKEILLSANISPAYIAEITADAFITDKEDAVGLLENSFFVPDIVESRDIAGSEISGNADSDVPVIDADETEIVMYTSGTTGQPKAVKQRLREFENDNAFVLSKWGEEFLKRKLCSTVSPHHIYGLLFSIMLPFSAGVPFKRERIEYPETFLQLTDDTYLIVTVPALLKRTVEAFSSFDLRSPYIFTAGGPLPPETAAMVKKAFGFWPLEVYGSTETSGIAWRQSKDGPEWNPFANAELWKNKEGCLVIKSPYIKEKEGFTTGDLVELLPDGRFLLKGRADSIVKIEEKRISLPEVESRIQQSGFVSDTAVIALEDKRQYLAAVVVLNEKGKDTFAESEKFQINAYFREHLQNYFENMVIPKRWRYVETLPRNSQGKLNKQELANLFKTPDNRSIFLPQGITGTVIEQTENTAIVEFSVPESSAFFDGHFPGFKILPAVAQFSIVYFCAKELFGTAAGPTSSGAEFSVNGARRIRFSNIITPNTKLRLELKFESSVLRFTITSLDGDKSYSAGSINCELAGVGRES